MGILNFFRGKKTKKHTGNVLDDDDRAQSLAIRRINSEIKKARKQAELEKARLELWRTQAETEEIRSLYYDDEEEEPNTPDSLLNLFLAQMLSKMNNSPAQAPLATTTHPTPSNASGFTVADMAHMWKSIPPPVQNRLKKLDDERLAAQISTYAPDISSEELKTAIQFIREQ